MLQKMIFIFSFLLALVFLAPSQGQCENWKEYFKDGDGTYYYDKDSIHYPKYHKSILGPAKNKEIVNVWIRDKFKNSEKIGNAYLLTIYCATREFEFKDELDEWNYELKDNSGERVHPANDYKKVRFTMKPGSQYESLLKKECP